MDRFGFGEKLAATYSRGVYKTTTIGKTVFDGRVRNGNGSDHSFMATKSASALPPGPDGPRGSILNRRRKTLKEQCRSSADSLKTAYRRNLDYNSRVKIVFPSLSRNASVAGADERKKRSSRTTD